MDKTETKKVIKAIIKQVHPDLFTSTPYERECNSQSLKALNAYLDELSRGAQPTPSSLDFYVRLPDGGELQRVSTHLPETGSLLPLFFAFGFITAEELRAGEEASRRGGDHTDTNFLAWLCQTVAEAVNTSEQHDALKWAIRKYRTDIEERFGLINVTAGPEYSVTLAEQEAQVEMLRVLNDGLLAVTAHAPGAFQDLSIQLYSRTNCPLDSVAFMDRRGTYGGGEPDLAMAAHVADDGVLHLVADEATIQQQLYSLDLAKAATLTRASAFWLRRVRQLTPLTADLLGVRSVWCDTKTEASSQRFVLWAGFLLERREAIAAQLAGRRYSFSIIVHSDPGSPPINFHPASPVLNIRSDCQPAALLAFLTSPTGLSASDAANEVHSSREAEEALLERVRTTFDAKCVIRICMSDKVMEGAQRMLDAAEAIKSAVDLRGACIALDDCYEVWDSGFISIPYNFKLQDLPGMLKLLQSGERAPAAASEQQQEQLAAATGAGAAAAAAAAAASLSAKNGANGNGAAAKQEESRRRRGAAARAVAAAPAGSAHLRLRHAATVLPSRLPGRSLLARPHAAAAAAAPGRTALRRFLPA